MPTSWPLDTGADPRRALGREALAHADALYSLARYLTGNASDADDLVETYAHALRAAGPFEPGSNPKVWSGLHTPPLRSTPLSAASASSSGDPESSGTRSSPT
jgi:Sigma-70 region 2